MLDSSRSYTLIPFSSNLYPSEFREGFSCGHPIFKAHDTLLHKPFICMKKKILVEHSNPLQQRNSLLVKFQLEVLFSAQHLRDSLLGLGLLEKDLVPVPNCER